MIRKLKIEDYEEVKNIFNEVYNLHYKNRPDIYNEKGMLSKEMFENVFNNCDALSYVYTINSKIVGLLFADRNKNYS